MSIRFDKIYWPPISCISSFNQFGWSRLCRFYCKYFFDLSSLINHNSFPDQSWFCQIRRRAEKKRLLATWLAKVEFGKQIGFRQLRSVTHLAIGHSGFRLIRHTFLQKVNLFNKIVTHSKSLSSPQPTRSGLNVLSKHLFVSRFWETAVAKLAHFRH